MLRHFPPNGATFHCIAALFYVADHLLRCSRRGWEGGRGCTDKARRPASLESLAQQQEAEEEETPTYGWQRR